MISADAMLDNLKRGGLEVFAGVPCSYLKPLINAANDRRDVRYLIAANEGDAVALACGAELGGKPGAVLMQNSGLGNAVSPLTSLAAIFRMPVLLIVSWRGRPGGPADEPQHALMGRITTRMLDVMEIPWLALSGDEAEFLPALERAVAGMQREKKPFALVAGKDTFSPRAFRSNQESSPRPAPDRPIADTLQSLPRLPPDEVLVRIQSCARPTDAILITTGFSGRALYGLGDRPNQFYMVGSMGCVISLTLGLAVAQPNRRIIAVDGDGALLMRMGAMAMLGYYRPPNVLHILLNNGVHESTGGQPSLSPSVNAAAVARACGYPHVARVHVIDELEQILASPNDGLRFAEVHTELRDTHELPRPSITPLEAAQRFRHWLQQ